MLPHWWVMRQRCVCMIRSLKPRWAAMDVWCGHLLNWVMIHSLKPFFFSVWLCSICLSCLKWNIHLKFTTVIWWIWILLLQKISMTVSLRNNLPPLYFVELLLHNCCWVCLSAISRSFIWKCYVIIGFFKYSALSV